jgi:hypothetical protein
MLTLLADAFRVATRTENRTDARPEARCESLPPRWSAPPHWQLPVRDLPERQRF